MEHRLTSWVHLNVSCDPINVEASEGEDLGDLATFAQLLFEEEHFALSGAHVTIASDNIALFIDHETCLIDIDVLALLVLAKKELDISRSVSVKHSHDLLQLKRLSIVIEKLGHQAAELLELLVVETLDPILVDDTSFFIDHEALH